VTVSRTPTQRTVSLALAGAGLALGAWAAIATRWTCDDIFITLRYAQQFLAGHGFVYNVGERVEGYTHFLWLLIITAFERLGADPVHVVVWGGVASFVATLAVFAVVSWRTALRRAGAVVPFTSLALAANRECVIWATSGLETAFFTLLLSLAFFVAFFSRLGERRRLALASLLLALAALTRPDGLLIYAVAGAVVAGRALLGTNRHRPERARTLARDAALFAAPLVLVYAPYVAWKVSYYGSFLPNTYYAKAAYLTYYSQGFYYLGLYFRGHPTSLLFLAVVPVLAVVFVRARRGASGESAAARASALPSRETAAALTALAVVGVYLVAFVARVGGDFMYARFVVPMLPFVYFLVEWTVRRALAPAPRWSAAVLVVLAVAVAAETPLRDRLMLKTEDGTVTVRQRRGVLDEHFYYTRAYLIADDRRAGELMRPVFDGLDATVLLRGQACFGYYANFRTLIEGVGLTDATLAHRPLEHRGRIGHEKPAPYDYLVERHVNFMFNRTPYKDDDYRLIQILLPGNVPVAGEIITWDNQLMLQLVLRLGDRLRCMSFLAYLDRYIAEELPTKSPEELAQDYADFKAFYFDANGDPGREARFLRALSREE